MSEVVFIAMSALYIISLATVDGLFNRLVFRDKRKLPYSSFHKRNIYEKYWEWKAIGFIFLIFLPIILPSVASFLIGGMDFLVLYWIVLLLVAWDILFGVLVFDDWVGDRPSIALPFLGWFNFPLQRIMIVRLFCATFLILLKIKRIV